MLSRFHPIPGRYGRTDGRTDRIAISVNNRAILIKNLHYSRYRTPWQSHDQKLKFLKFKMTAAAILKIAFLAITHRSIVRFQRNFVRGSRTACRRGMTKTANFWNPRWRTAASLKIVKSPYLSEKSSDFDEIWYTTSVIEPDFLYFLDSTSPCYLLSFSRYKNLLAENREFILPHLYIQRPFQWEQEKMTIR